MIRLLVRCSDAACRRPGTLSRYGRHEQEKSAHPEIDPVGAVKQDQAEGHHRQQAKQQCFGGIRA